MTFVNLHQHTIYSQLDGACKIPELVDRAKELGMPSVSMTDHGNVHGLIDFYKECKKQDIKPILGEEFYFCDDRTVKEKVDSSGSGKLDGSDKRYYHLTVLAADNDGYHNLIKLSSDAYLEGFYFKPRSDYSMLEKHSKGIVIGSGCLGGPVLQPLLHDNYDLALSTAARLQDIVGKDHFFIEMMDHGLPEQAKTNPFLLKIAKTLDAPPLWTEDCHYLHQHDSFSHSVLLCSQTGSKLSDPKRFKFHNDEYYLKSPEEMYALDPDRPELCSNTLLIADRCNVEIDFNTMHLPNFPIPSEYKDDNDMLKDLVWKGLQKRYGTPQEVHIERAKYELSVIKGMGLSSYFLIFWDLVSFCKQEGIMYGPARGSAASSIIAYALEITKVDPIKYDLIFERFLNPDRIAMPDIDWDIDTRYRDNVINYTRQKYGDDHVAQIITFGTIKARTAIRDTARVLGYDYATGDKISKALPPLLMGKDTPLEACFELDPKYEFGYENAAELRDLYNTDPDAQRIIDTAKGIEGSVRQAGVHAAAVVIGDDSLVNLIPIEKRKDGPITTQYEKNTIEDLGLLKMDYLGLRNLDVISDALELMGEEQDFLDSIPVDDFKALKILKKGYGIGLFQVECLSGDTYIAKDFTIKDLFENPSLKKKLLSVYIDSGKRKWNNVIDVSYGGVKPVYRVLTESGRYIKASKDHKFLTEDGWVKLEDLSLGQKTLMSRGEYAVYRECLDCGKQIDDNPYNSPIRCYVCSAHFHSNPSKNKDKISKALKKTYENGNSPWNKGLTKETSPILKETAEKISKTLTGRTWEEIHGFEKAHRLRREQSERSKGEKCYFFGKSLPNSGSYKNAKSGFREDLGHSVRSSWGADVARLLKFMQISYEYEKTRFYMTKPDGSKCSYLPDFYLPDYDLYIEVKGYYRDEDKEKMQLFSEQYSDIKLIMVDKTKFAELELRYKHIVPNWECPVIPDFSWLEEIVSIEQVGEEETYDIAMASPGNNFIANGFVVHNSRSMRDLLKDVSPDNIEDISAVLALYRPGPMAENMHRDYADRKHGRKFARIFHDDAKEILANTYHLPIYQEQIFQIAQRFAGFTYAEADVLRKAMGKKMPELMAEQREKFVQGCIDNEYNEDFSNKLFDMVQEFSGYSFNLSHSVSYSFITYWTAYLKAHYPREYMAALCSSVWDDLDKTGVYLYEARQMGLKVYPPNVNTSDINYGVEEDGIRIGFRTLKNMGESAVGKLLKERERGGPFVSLYDLAWRFNPNINTLKSLAYSGALDQFGTRQGIAAVAENVLESTRKKSKKISKDQGSLFSVEEENNLIDFDIPDTEFSDSQKLKMEKETLGVYISGHPLDEYENTGTMIDDLKESEKNSRHQILCLIDSVQVKTTKKGQSMAILEVEDQTGRIEVVVFPRSWNTYRVDLSNRGISKIDLKVGTDYRDNQNYILEACESIDDSVKIEEDEIFGIFLPKKFHKDLQYMAKLKGLVLANQGAAKLKLFVGKGTTLKTSEDYFVEPSDKLKGKIKTFFLEWKENKEE